MSRYLWQFTAALFFVALRVHANTLDITGGLLTYTASGTMSNLTISSSAGNYTFNDTAQSITLTTNAISAGWSGNGTSTVTGPTSSVTANFTINLQAGVNALTVQTPITLTGTNTEGTVGVMGGPVTLASGATLSGGINLNSGATLIVRGTVSSTVGVASAGTLIIWGSVSSVDNNGGTVVTNGQVGSDAQLRALIANLSNGDTITFTGNITLGSALPAISANVTITGASYSLDGDSLYQVISIASGATVSISGLTIQNGLDAGTSGSSGGGGIQNRGTLHLSSCVVTGNSQTGNGAGGGILNRSGATLTIDQCTISNNVASALGGEGGGLLNDGTATITNSTFSGNTAQGTSAAGQGGAIFNDSILTITGCTIAGNTTADPNTVGGGGGGGIDNTGVLAVNNSTISGNTQAGGNVADAGGGILQAAGLGSSTLVSTILAGNTTFGAGIDGDGAFTDGGYNMIGSSTTLRDSPTG